MRKIWLILAIALASAGVDASWYWPFGEDEEAQEAPKRLSDLMEPASIAIDEAADLVADGKANEAVAAYRKALQILDQIEYENPDRAATPEFASLRNKRAYVSAAIDSILLQQARDNAKAVAITDTTELERRFAALRKPQQSTEAPKLEEVHVDHWGNTEKSSAAKPAAEPKREAMESAPAAAAPAPAGRRAKLEAAMIALAGDDFKTALGICDDLLDENPKDIAALNLKAVTEHASGNDQAAEQTLKTAIRANPRDHHAYFNMADLIVDMGGNMASAKRYYETGLKVGGERDQELEEKLGL